jgi:hypothetical protein
MDKERNLREGELIRLHGERDKLTEQIRESQRKIERSQQLLKRIDERAGARKSAQDDKWNFCLTADTLCPAYQERP